MEKYEGDLSVPTNKPAGQRWSLVYMRGQIDEADLANHFGNGLLPPRRGPQKVLLPESLHFTTLGRSNLLEEEQTTFAHGSTNVQIRGLGLFLSASHQTPFGVRALEEHFSQYFGHLHGPTTFQFYSKYKNTFSYKNSSKKEGLDEHRREKGVTIDLCQ